jgi:hypothetical protein
MKRWLLYSTLATCLALFAGLVGARLVDAPERVGVLVGAALALAIQVGVVGLVGHLLFPGRRMLLFAVGMGTRLVAVFAVFLAAPLLGLPLAPTLLTLVTVFLLTTLLEPVAVQLDTQLAAE